MITNSVDSPRYKAILFDLDGTLLDSVPIIIEASRISYEKMGLPFDETAVRKLIGIPLKEQSRIIAGSNALAFLDTYREVYRSLPDSNLFPEAENTLRCLKENGYRLGVVTSKIRKSAMRTIENLQIADYFECIVTADDVARPKPHPEPVLKALQLMEIQPDQALFVGDSIFDIKCGHAAGVAVAAVTWGSGTVDELMAGSPEMQFDNLQDFNQTLCRFYTQ